MSDVLGAVISVLLLVSILALCLANDRVLRWLENWDSKRDRRGGE